jgi:hypothetical protein
LEGLVRGDAPFESADVGLRHLLIGLDREEKGHVDPDPLAQQRLDRGDSFRCAGDLDQEIRAIDPTGEALGCGDCPVCRGRWEKPPG